MLPLARNYYHFAVQIGSCWLAYPARCRRHGPMDEARSRPFPDVRKREGNADFPIWTTRKPWRNGWPKAIPKTFGSCSGGNIMRTELISIATDTLPLDGAFYLPEG